MRKLSKREKGIAVAGLIAGALILIGAYVVSPFLDARAQASAKLQREVRLLQRSVQAIQQHEVYETQLEELRRLLEQYRQNLLEAQNSSIAYIQLEETVRTLATEHGVKIMRSNPLKEKQIGERYSKITLQINAEGNMTELTDFLYGISAHPRFLLVEAFFLRSFRQRDRIQLRPRLNVSGFIRLS